MSEFKTILEESVLAAGDEIIRIDSYVVLAKGPSEDWKRSGHE